MLIKSDAHSLKSRFMNSSQNTLLDYWSYMSTKQKYNQSQGMVRMEKTNQSMIDQDFQKVKCLVEANKIDQALQQLQKLLKNKPAFVDGYKLHIRLLFMVEKQQKIDEVINSACKYIPKFHAQIEHLWKWYQSINAYGRQLVLICKILKIHSECLECAASCVGLLKKMVNSRSVNIVNSELDQRDSTKYLYYWLRGLIESNMGNTSKAQQYFKQSINLKPDFYLAYNTLVESMRSQKRFQEIKQFYLQSFLVKGEDITQISQYHMGLQSSSPPIFHFAYYFSEKYKFQKAKKLFYYYIRTMKIIDYRTFRSYESRIYTQIGSICLKQRLIKPALMWLRKAMNIESYINYITVLQTHLMRLKVWFILALCQAQCFEEANKIVDKIQSKDYIPMYKTLIMVYDRLNNHQKVIQIYLFLSETSDKISFYQQSCAVYAIIAYHKMKEYSTSFNLWQEFSALNLVNIDLLFSSTLYRLIDYWLQVEEYKKADLVQRLAILLTDYYCQLNQCDARMFKDLNETYRLRIEARYNKDVTANEQ